MDPATLAAILGAGAQGLGGAMQSRTQDRASKRKSEEERRATRQRLLSDLLKMQLEEDLNSRKIGNEMATMRAKNYQDRAQAFRQSLLG